MLNSYLDDLRGIQTAGIEAYAADKRTHRFAERTLQMAIECCLDIGQHVIADEGWRSPNEYRDVFAVLVEENVLSGDLLPNFTAMAGFRNLLVHNYAEIDHARVYDILQSHLSDFDAFARAIVAYLKL